MALPMVNSPRYSTILPSTGENIDYRPYTVKEEKILMIAMESKDQKQIIRAMKDVISACIEGIDVGKITTFDIEWIFLKLRSKAVGEKVELKLKCQDNECEAQTQVEINLEEIEVKGEVKNNVIQITEEVGCVIKYPAIELVEKYDQEKLNSVDGAFDMIVGCIESIYDADYVYDCKNETPEDIRDFLDSLTSEQFQKITEFFQGVPQVQHDLNWKCSKCEKENSIELKGIESFFT